MDLRNLSTVELVVLCAEDTANVSLWSEFLRRFSSKIRSFVRASLRRFSNGSGGMAKRLSVSGLDQQNDLFQDTIVQLAEDDCAVMKRFRGSREDQFIAYLAAITRSVVRDSLRRQKAFSQLNDGHKTGQEASERTRLHRTNGERGLDSERHFLAKELWRLTVRALGNKSRHLYARDKKIFELYYSHGLSVNQIARLGEIRLSKTAVENVLKRLKDRVRAIADKKSYRRLTTMRNEKRNYEK